MGPKKTLQPVVPLQINDPCDTGSQKLRKTKVLQLCDMVHQEYRDTVKSWEQFSENLKQELAALEPPLPLPSTREQCAAAVSRLQQKFVPLVRQWQIKRQQLHKQYTDVLNRAAIVTATYHRVESSGIKFTKNDKWQLHTLGDVNVDLKRHLDKTQGGGDKLLLQEQIHKLLDGQLNDVKSFVLDDINPYLQHLNKKRKRAPKVVFGNRLFRPASSNTDLPLEIQTMIYAHADLESCVNLRRVSRSWYQAFKASEEFFENKVKEHFPWMLPEDEMNTWGLCALVFVQRTRSKKWSSQREINRIPQSLRKPTPIHEVVANELELGEKLPLGFETVEGDVIDVQTDEVVRWKQRTGNGQYSLSHNPRPEFPRLHLKYLQCIPEPQRKEDKFNTVCCDDEKTVIKYKPGGEPTKMLVLPPNTKLKFKRESYDKEAIESTKYYVTVRCGAEYRADIYVFDRTKPLHYDNAFKHQEMYRQWHQVKHIMYLTQSAYSSGNSYVFADFQHRRTHNYCTSTAFPVAFYDGLIWWASKDGSKIFPTFVDLQRPAEVYYRKDKMLMIEEPHGYSEREIYRLYRQSTKPGQGRFLLRHCNGGVIVIDLAFGTVTKVVNPRKNQTNGANVALGYVDGKFCARFVDNETLKKYELAEMWKTEKHDRHESRFYY